MSAVAREFEYMLARAKKQGDMKLYHALSRAYERYLDQVTS